MFGFIADFLSSTLTILLPAYLSYKALRTGDPAQTTPWLIYFIILSLALVFESYTLFIIGWFPFYSWIRLVFLLYLVLPQTQGAKVLYLSYAEPFILKHESAIDIFIGETHQKLEELGLGYLNLGIDWLRDRVLGQKSPPAQSQNSNISVGSYASSLLSRFAMPTAGANAAGAASNVYGMLSGVAGAAMGGMAAVGGGRSRDNPSSGEIVPSADQPLIPEIMRDSSAEEKSHYIAQQRERLANLMRALDKEQQTLDLAYGDRPGASAEPSRSRPSSSGSNLGMSIGSGLKSKSRSEVSFEQVEHDDLHNGHAQRYYQESPSSRRTTSGSWVPTGVSSWLGGGSGGTADESQSQRKSTSKGWSAAMEVTEAVQGMSSGIDTRR